MIKSLDPFDAIAWDFDGTLINHPKSSLMHQYIKAHPQKKHVIITFRTHGAQYLIFEEMQFLYPGSPGKDRFGDVINISNLAWLNFTRYDRMRYHGRLKGPLTPHEEYYINWKGSICKQHGLSVLVDDRTDHVASGCEKHGIVFIHPDDL
jgi:hypothetical protein